jgi:serine/threonine-protein kinase
MEPVSVCPECGAALSPNAPLGLCPWCLIHRGLEDETGTRIGPASADGDVLATLAATFGPIRRVLLRDTDPETGPGPLVRPSSPEMPTPDDRHGRYQLLGEIARGGIGAVLKGTSGGLAKSSGPRWKSS